ncbi:MAG: fused MFS/spermidine synthase [Chloroflexi bacterium]|nr:fused MFS/spermidine synthase [Chloroflexota bacterium]
MSPIGRRQRAERGLLYLGVLVGGAAVLAVELSLSRLLGRVFGASNIVWSNVIALVLLCLCAGYYLGGRLIDRRPQASLFYGLMVLSGLSLAVVPYVAPAVLSWCGQWASQTSGGVLWGSFVAAVVLGAPVETLLGCLSPCAIRLILQDVQSSGRAAGRLYAISTLGSLLGTFVPVLLLIPVIGTARTILVVAMSLVLVGSVGLCLIATRTRRAVAGVVAGTLACGTIVVTPPAPATRTLPGVALLSERESTYNLVRVGEVQRPFADLPEGARLLLLNEGSGVQSVWRRDGNLGGGLWDLFLAAPYFDAVAPEPRRVCIVGLAGGSLAQLWRRAYPSGLRIDGVELDPAVIELSRRYLALDDAGVNVVEGDGRLALLGLPGPYDVIALDAYRTPYVPWHLLTVEFLREVSAKLGPRGVVAVNLTRGGDGSDRRLVEGATATLLEVFPTLHTMDMHGTLNTVVVATKQPSSVTDLSRNQAGLHADSAPELRRALAHAWESLVPTTASDLIFTDDRTEAERIVDSMVLGGLASSPGADR